MPPLSPLATSMPMIRSNSDVLPWSTCPRNVTTGARGCELRGMVFAFSISPSSWSSRLRAASIRRRRRIQSPAAHRSASNSELMGSSQAGAQRPSTCRAPAAPGRRRPRRSCERWQGNCTTALPLRGAAVLGPIAAASTASGGRGLGRPRPTRDRRTASVAVVRLRLSWRCSRPPRRGGELRIFFGGLGRLASTVAADRRLAEELVSEALAHEPTRASGFANVRFAFCFVLAQMLLQRFWSGAAGADGVCGELQIGLLRCRFGRARRVWLRDRRAAAQTRIDGATRAAITVGRTTTRLAGSFGLHAQDRRLASAPWEEGNPRGETPAARRSPWRPERASRGRRAAFGEELLLRNDRTVAVSSSVRLARARPLPRDPRLLQSSTSTLLSMLQFFRECVDPNGQV